MTDTSNWFGNCFNNSFVSLTILRELLILILSMSAWASSTSATSSFQYSKEIPKNVGSCLTALKQVSAVLTVSACLIKIWS